MREKLTYIIDRYFYLTGQYGRMSDYVSLETEIALYKSGCVYLVEYPPIVTLSLELTPEDLSRMAKCFWEGGKPCAP